MKNRKSHIRTSFEKKFLNTFLGEEYVNSLDILETGELESNILNSSNGSENRTDLPLIFIDTSCSLLSPDSVCITEPVPVTVPVVTELFIDLESSISVFEGKNPDSMSFVSYMNGFCLASEKSLKVLNDWVVLKLINIFPEYFSEPFMDLEAFIVEEHKPEYSVNGTLLFILLFACIDLYSGFIEWFTYSKNG